MSVEIRLISAADETEALWDRQVSEAKPCCFALRSSKKRHHVATSAAGNPCCRSADTARVCRVSIELVTSAPSQQQAKSYVAQERPRPPIMVSKVSQLPSFPRSLAMSLSSVVCVSDGVLLL